MAPRIVSVAIPFKVEPAADGAGVDVRLLMVSSRKHPLRWICGSTTLFVWSIWLASG